MPGGQWRTLSPPAGPGAAVAFAVVTLLVAGITFLRDGATRRCCPSTSHSFR